jgi:hypothetical protein
MSNIRSLADLNGEESDHDSDHNDYYAGGEKRCARAFPARGPRAR